MFHAARRSITCCNRFWWWSAKMQNVFLFLLLLISEIIAKINYLESLFIEILFLNNCPSTAEIHRMYNFQLVFKYNL